MKRADVLVLERDLDAVTTELGRLGMLHLEQARLEGGDELLAPAETEAEVARLQALGARVNALASRLDLRAPGREESAADGAAKAAARLDLDRVEELVAALERQVEAAIQRRDTALAEEARLVSLADRLEPFQALSVPMSRIAELDFLHFAVGTVPEDRMRGLSREVRDDVVLVPVGGGRAGFAGPSPMATSPRRGAAEERRRLMAVSSKKGRWALETALQESQFVPDVAPDEGVRVAPVTGERRPEGAEPPHPGAGVPQAPASRASVPPGQALAAVQERLNQVRGDLAAIESELGALRRRHGERLGRYARWLEVRRRILAAQALFGRTASTVLISGWVPSTRAETLRGRVERTAQGRAVVEFRDPVELGPLAPEPPVQFSNSRLLRPFEVLISGFGTPTYTEIEPTAFVAATYLVMFGLMFGDVGQGAVLAAVGLLLSRRAGSRSIRDIGAVMGYAGLSAVLVGAMYNSVFGKEGVLPWPPVLAPLGEGRHVQVLLGITLGFGILVITLGTALNIINRLGRRDFLGGVLDRFGLAGMVIYWGAIGLGLKALVVGSAVRAWELGLFIVLPLVLLFFKEPIYAILTHKHKLYHEGVFNGLMEAGVEMLETFSAFLANTLSFLRVGAFALAHAGLCLGVFEIERLVRGGGGPARTLASVATVVVGNALIIALEGLVVSIQAVRLEYYEFMSRFFRGTGTAYRPFEIGPPAATNRPGRFPPVRIRSGQGSAGL